MDISLYKKKWLKIIIINFSACMICLLAMFILTLFNDLVFQVIGKVEFIIIYCIGILTWIAFIILNKILIIEDKDIVLLTVTNKKDKQEFDELYPNEKYSKKGNVINIIKNVLDYYLIIIFALLTVLIIFTCVLFPAEVNQHSMEETLSGGDGVNEQGDKVLVFKTSKVEKGNIIVFAYDRDVQFNGICDNGELLIKRVIATEGDFFECINGQIYINGVKQTESYVRYHENDTYDIFNVVNRNSNKEEIYDMMDGNKIPEGYILVLGDNRANSNDSEEFGLVKLSQVSGVVKFYRDELGWHKMN